MKRLLIILMSLQANCANQEYKKESMESVHKPSYLPAKIGDTILYTGTFEYHCRYNNQKFDTLYYDTAKVFLTSQDSFHFHYNVIYYKLLDTLVYDRIFRKGTFLDFKIENDSLYKERELTSESLHEMELLFTPSDSVYYKYNDMFQSYRDDSWTFKGKRIR